MQRMLLGTLFWLWMLVGVLASWCALPLAWAQERELSADIQAALQESDTQCTGPVLKLEAVQVPLRLCKKQPSNDDPVEWLGSMMRRIHFMGTTLLFECELDLEAGSNITTLTPAMNAAVRQADKLVQKLVGEDYVRVLQPLVDMRTVTGKPEERRTLPTPADFHKKWEPVRLLVSFNVGTDGQLHSVFFVDWATREPVRPHDEHMPYDVLSVRIVDGILEKLL